MEMDRVLGPGVDKRMFSLSVSKFAQAIGRENIDLWKNRYARCAPRWTG